jgi:hypothetical protein
LAAFPNTLGPANPYQIQLPRITGLCLTTRIADPLSLTVTIVTFVTKAFALSKEIHSAVEQISKAQKHNKAIRADLEDFYFILGCIKGYLEDECFANSCHDWPIIYTSGQ